jgi:prephenate dehydrogenase
MLAYALVDCLAGMEEREEIFKYAAGGFADFTRIASSSPEMWHDICLSNSEALLATLELFSKHMENIQQAIKQGDSQALLEIFERAKQARDKFAGMRTV